MKGLKKIALVTAIAAAPFAANAELTAMDDSAMSAATGQAGITIEVTGANVKVGEVAYKDGGYVALAGIHLGSNMIFDADDTNDDIDNFNLYIDVAGSTPDLGAPALGGAYLTAAGATVVGLNEVDQNALIDDGDLVISLRATDPSLGARSVDFGLGIESVTLGTSTATVGDVAADGGTVLLSTLELTGYLGPIDIVIDGHNGGMNISAFFNVAGAVEMPFIATSMDFSVHNSRGASVVALGTAQEDTFAHVQMNVSTGTNAAGNTALALDLQDFSGDIDLTNIQLGDNGASIGDLYITDLQITAQTLIYGH